MKFIYCLLGLLVATVTTQAQTDRFTHRLDYVTTNQEEGFDFSMKHYLPEKYSEKAFSVFNLQSDYGYNVTTALTRFQFFLVESSDLENTFKIGSPTWYSNGEDTFKDNYFYPIKEVKKTAETNTILSTTCTYYNLIPVDSEMRMISLCIDTKNIIDNASYFLPKQATKGLIMEIREPNEEGQNSSVQLKNIEKVNVQYSFDFDKEKLAIEAMIAEQAELYDEAEAYADSAAVVTDYAGFTSAYDDPLCAYYASIPEGLSDKVNAVLSSYMSSTCSHLLMDTDYDGETDFKKDALLSFFQRDSKSFTKNLAKNKLISKSESKQLLTFFKDIHSQSKVFVYTPEEIDESVIDYDNIDEVAAYEVYEPYQSTYKAIDMNVLSLAIETFNDEGVMKAIPTHCSDFKTKVPTFENKQLGQLILQYVGQSCDFYYSEHNSYTVDIKSTIDSIRKSILSIENLHDSLSKADKKKLNEFLNSLD